MDAYIPSIEKINGRFSSVRRQYLILGISVMGATALCIVWAIITKKWTIAAIATVTAIWASAIANPFDLFRMAWSQKLIVLPIEKMSVDLTEAWLSVTMGDVHADIPLDRVTGARLIADTAISARPGFSGGLLVRIEGAAPLVVPDAALNFRDLVEWIRKNRSLTMEYV